MILVLTISGSEEIPTRFQRGLSEIVLQAGRGVERARKRFPKRTSLVCDCGLQA